MSQTKVYIDPRSRILYSSFYIQGLYDFFGKKNVFFSSKYFSKLDRKNESHSFDHYMAFVILSTNKIISKVIIDFRDKPSVKENAYNWCDKYAKINYNFELTDPKFQHKLISIPPGFGIKIWSFWKTAYFCFANLLRIDLSPLVSIKQFIADYYAQFTRERLNQYINKDDKSPHDELPYVFMIGTLWSHQSCLEGVNFQRKKFIELCKSAKCKFEGGFFSQKKFRNQELDNFIFRKKFSSKDYIKKTKLSAFVFNTAAVHNCHGWKLGEFLAMGKAIISTPLINVLPEELVHGKNLHIISKTEDLQNVINLLLKDIPYRKFLETGAKEYYLKYVDPKKVIERIQNSR